MVEALDGGALIQAVIALFIVIDVVGSIPIFLGLTRGMSSESRRRVLSTGAAVAFILLVIFALLGQRVLQLFNISFQSFLIAGGLLLVILAVKVILTGRWEEPEMAPEAIGAVPIAFPLLAGPGAITTTIITLQTSGLMTALIAVAVNFLVTWVVLRYVEPLNKILGRTGSAVVARVMAILIAAIGVGFILEGTSQYLAEIVTPR